MIRMKRLLIPTDFSISSLNLVKSALEKLDNESHHITMVVGRESPNSITDLLFYSKEKALKDLMSNDFIDAIQLIQNRYSTKINSISFDILHSQNKNYIKNYISGNNFDLLILPEQLSFAKKTKQGFNLIPLFKEMEIETMYVNWDHEERSKETNKISDLFFHKN